MSHRSRQDPEGLLKRLQAVQTCSDVDSLKNPQTLDSLCAPFGCRGAWLSCRNMHPASHLMGSKPAVEDEWYWKARSDVSDVRSCHEKLDVSSGGLAHGRGW